MADPHHLEPTVLSERGTRTAFGRSLKRVRRLAGLTQEMLAEQAGYSATYLGMLERGERLPHSSTIDTLSSALGLAKDEHALLVAAARDIGSNSVHPARLQASSQLTGRSLEIALLDQHLAGQGPPVLLLRGEPGIGKTRLLDEAARQAVRHGWTPLSGSSHRSGGSGDSYAPITDAIGRFMQGQRAAALRSALRGCPWLARLLPELGKAVSEPLPAWTLPLDRERHLVFRAVIQFMRNIAGPAGTLLLLDDLQWSGPDALDLLVALSHAGVEPGPPIRIAGAYRHTDDQPNTPLAMALTDLVQAGLVTVHAVTPLAHDEARILLESAVCGASLSTERLEQVVQRTGGVPFFIVSYAQGLQSNSASTSGGDLPWTLVQSIRQRVAALPAPAQDLLQTAAVFGRQVPRSVLVSAIPQSDAVLLESVETACRARLLEECQDGYRFVHDVIREVIEADLSSFRSVLLHRRITEALEQAEGHAGVEALAHHAQRADLPERAIAYQEQAADLAREQLALATAVDRYRALAERLDTLQRGRDSARVREKLGSVLATMGRYREALSAYETAATAYRDRQDQEGVVRVLALIGHVHTHTGTTTDGIACLQGALVELASTGTSLNLAALYATLTELYFVSGQYTALIELVRQATDAARSAGDQRSQAVAEGRKGVALLLLGRLDEAIITLKSTVDLATSAGELNAHCRALANLGVLHFMRGEFGLASGYRERALTAARCQGNAVSIIRTLANRGEGALYAGDWARARLDLSEALALAKQIDETGAAAYPMLDLVLLSLMEGRWHEVETHVAEATRLARRGGDLQILRWAATLQAEHDILEGRPESAVSCLVLLRDRPSMEEADVTYLLPTLAWAYLESGDPTEAGKTAAQAVRRARTQQNHVILVDALRVQAMVSAFGGAQDTAIACLDEGLAHASAMPYPYMQARLLHLYATAIASTSPDSAFVAGSRLQAALAIYNHLGARPDADQAGCDLTALPYTQRLLTAGVVITAGQWSRMLTRLQPSRQRGRPRADSKRTLAAILYVRRSGCSWGTLPAVFGDGATAHRHFQKWKADYTWEHIEDILHLRF